jgi:hypothetical protein
MYTEDIQVAKILMVSRHSKGIRNLNVFDSQRNLSLVSIDSEINIDCIDIVIVTE